VKRSPMKRNPPKPRRPSNRRDGVDPADAEYVLSRDRGCVAYRHGFALDEPCQGRLHVHHVVLRSQGGTHDPSNLLALCEHHHRLAHDHRRSEAEACYIIRRRTT
jgi:hypothetical protein